MWWGWRSRARIYLGQGVVMAETRDGKSTCRTFERGLPWEEALDLITGDLPPHAALDVYLSGALAPAILMEFPEGLRQYRERLSYATSACTRLLGLPPGSLRTELDPLNSQICVAVEGQVERALENWSTGQRFFMQRCAPSWAWLSARREMREAHLAILRECDSLTALCACTDGSTSAISIPLRVQDSKDAALRRALTVLGAVAPVGNAALWLDLVEAASSAPSGLVPPWAAHWSQL